MPIRAKPKRLPQKRLPQKRLPQKRLPQTIDDYLATVTDDQRVVLEKLRQTIRKMVPKAEECINYGVAAFRVDGVVLVGFGATAKHLTFYPMSGRTVSDLQDELQDFETSKGAIHFQLAKPLPNSLIRKLIQARQQENQARLASKKKSAR